MSTGHARDSTRAAETRALLVQSHGLMELRLRLRRRKAGENHTQRMTARDGENRNRNGECQRAVTGRASRQGNRSKPLENGAFREWRPNGREGTRHANICGKNVLRENSTCEGPEAGRKQSPRSRKTREASLGAGGRLEGGGGALQERKSKRGSWGQVREKDRRVCFTTAALLSCNVYAMQLALLKRTVQSG